MAQFSTCVPPPLAQSKFCALLFALFEEHECELAILRQALDACRSERSAGEERRTDVEVIAASSTQDDLPSLFAHWPACVKQRLAPPQPAKGVPTPPSDAPSELHIEKDVHDVPGAVVPSASAADAPPAESAELEGNAVPPVPAELRSDPRVGVAPAGRRESVVRFGPAEKPLANPTTRLSSHSETSYCSSEASEKEEDGPEKPASRTSGSNGRRPMPHLAAICRPGGGSKRRSTVIFSEEALTRDDEREADRLCEAREAADLEVHKRWLRAADAKLSQASGQWSASGNKTRVTQSVWFGSFRMSRERREGHTDKGSSATCFFDVFVAHPNDGRSLIFDCLRIILLSYDLVSVPFEVFGPDPNLFTDGMIWFSMLFWTLDIGHNLTMGFYEYGEIIMSARPIAWRYFSSWFPLDAAIVCFDWLAFFILSTHMRSNAGRLVRTFKNVRLIRLLRGARMGGSIRQVEQQNNSELVSIIWSVCKHFMTMLTIFHLMACAWYFIGTSCAGSCSNWIEIYLDVQSPLEVRYLTSIHYILSQFQSTTQEVHPHNVGEQIFTVFVSLFAVGIMSVFISEITNAVFRLNGLSKDATKHFWLLRCYLSQCGTPAPLAVRVLTYCEHAYRSQSFGVLEEHVEVLSLLSTSIRGELMSAIYQPKVSHHPFVLLISKLCAETMQNLCCVSFKRILLGARLQLFSSKDVCLHMYFVVSGRLFYNMDGRSEEEEVAEGSWLCEPVLWTTWSFKGSLRATEQSELLALESERFGCILEQNPEARIEASNYAAGFVKALNRDGAAKVGDLFYPQPLAEGLWFRLTKEFSTKRGRVVSTSLKSWILSGPNSPTRLNSVGSADSADVESWGAKLARGLRWRASRQDVEAFDAVSPTATP